MCKLSLFGYWFPESSHLMPSIYLVKYSFAHGAEKCLFKINEIPLTTTHVSSIYTQFTVATRLKTHFACIVCL